MNPLIILIPCILIIIFGYIIINFLSEKYEYIVDILQGFSVLMIIATVVLTILLRG